MKSALRALIDDLTSAIATQPCSGTRCAAVEELLVASARPDLLPDAFTAADPDHYARHLVHRDPQGRFSVLAMVWSPGQGTPIHDHGGLWVVECVVRGRMEVRTFDLQQDGTRPQLECVGVTRATVGEAGHLIPPHDQHILHNPFDEVAVTLHVYGGDLESCTVFEPHPGGGYEATEIALEVSQ